MDAQASQADGGQTQRAQLFNWKATEDAPDALTYRQLLELKDGVRAAIENGDGILGAPGDLSDEHWNHKGVGISVYMHRSGVVVLQSQDETLVTTAETLDNMHIARAMFFGNPGPVDIKTDDLGEDG